MRRVISSRLAAVLALIAAFWTMAATAPWRTRASNVYFACGPGLTFEISRDDAARCRRPAGVRTTELAPCPAAGAVALVPAIDQDGITDMCTATSGPAVAVARACPAGYTKRVLAGTDRCEEPVPEEIQAPSIPVVR